MYGEDFGKKLYPEIGANDPISKYAPDLEKREIYNPNLFKGKTITRNGTTLLKFKYNKSMYYCREEEYFITYPDDKLPPGKVEKSIKDELYYLVRQLKKKGKLNAKYQGKERYSINVESNNCFLKAITNLDPNITIPLRNQLKISKTKNCLHQVEKLNSLLMPRYALYLHDFPKTS